jgi:hypothetical protein
MFYKWCGGGGAYTVLLFRITQLTFYRWGALLFSVTCNCTTNVLQMGGLRPSVACNCKTNVLQMGGLTLFCHLQLRDKRSTDEGLCLHLQYYPTANVPQIGGGAYTFLLFRITQQTFYKWEAYAFLSLAIARQTFYNWGTLRFTVTRNCTTFYLKSYSKRSTVQTGGSLFSVV